LSPPRPYTARRLVDPIDGDGLPSRDIMKKLIAYYQLHGLNTFNIEVPNAFRARV